MKKVILRFNGMLTHDELERIEEQFKSDLDRNGFIVIDNRFDVIEFDDGKEEEN